MQRRCSRASPKAPSLSNTGRSATTCPAQSSTRLFCLLTVCADVERRDPFSDLCPCSVQGSELHRTSWLGRVPARNNAASMANGQGVCTDVCMDMCIDMCGRAHITVYRLAHWRAYRHVHIHVYRHGSGSAVPHGSRGHRPGRARRRRPTAEGRRPRARPSRAVQNFHFLASEIGSLLTYYGPRGVLIDLLRTTWYT